MTYGTEGVRGRPVERGRPWIGNESAPRVGRRGDRLPGVQERAVVEGVCYFWI